MCGSSASGSRAAEDSPANAPAIAFITRKPALGASSFDGAASFARAAASGASSPRARASAPTPWKIRDAGVGDVARVSVRVERSVVSEASRRHGVADAKRDGLGLGRTLALARLFMSVRASSMRS